MTRRTVLAAAFMAGDPERKRLAKLAREGRLAARPRRPGGLPWAELALPAFVTEAYRRMRGGQ